MGAESVARNVSKTVAFKGMTGSAATAAVTNAIMEASLGVAEKEATFFQTLTTENLSNRQQANNQQSDCSIEFRN